MSSSRIVPFKIKSIDSLGQGVSKETDKITFIPKTMIGDEGMAEILAERKGVAFGKAIEFSQRSSQRTESFCPHFNDCPSCHFLHIHYEDEISIKKDTFERLFRKSSIPSLEILRASRRSSYRNRIQLHYDLAQKKLGMLDAKTSLIMPVPECSIGLPVIQEEMKRLYQNEKWLLEAPKSPNKGHVEIYWRNNEVKTSWNRPYAEGGFTQVFQEMNEELRQILQTWVTKIKPTDLLDLFAGNGNLSQGTPYSQRLCVDVYPHFLGEEFLSQDLYHKSALVRVKKELKRRQMKPQLMLIDPPRSGIKDLELWLQEIQPQYLAYISCDPHTLARDLSPIKDYSIERAFLIDFFPSTFHFETMLFLKRNS
jgi:23S rRNA (uracil1939-C5)-methyltransferase